MLNRRSFLKAAAGSFSSAVLLPHALAQNATGLKSLPRAKGRLIGTVVDQWQLENATWRSLVLENFNLVTLGRLKWGFSRPGSDTFDFTETDWMVRFCSEHSLSMHGHNLCWNVDNPIWLERELTPGNAERLLETHITRVMKRYAGAISSYDVVNEPTAPWCGRPDGLYPGPWLNALGPGYIELAFQVAKEADPEALRVLNIAHVEQGGSGSDAARRTTLQLIEQLLKKAVPLQAIGFESHLVAGYAAPSAFPRKEFVRELRQLGLQVLITELDVDDTHVQGSTSSRDQVVASCYGEYVSEILVEADPSRILFFSPSDLRNWYDEAQSSQYTRPDGQAHRPGLFDASLQPKPAYNAVASALTRAHSLSETSA